MNNILTRKVNRKYVIYLSWCIILFIIVIAFKRFPLSSGAIGDENAYTGEVDYFARYGLYQSLSQGASVVYSLLIFGFAKLFSIDYLISARILTVLSFVVCCVLLLKCLGQFAAIGYAERYFGVIYFGTIGMAWLWKGLPDMMSVAFLLAGFYCILRSKNNRYLLLAGLLVFMGFAVKPVVVFAVPGLVAFIFLRELTKEVWMRNMLRAFLFLVSFGGCFIVYHVPGYQVHHKLMLEDKNHTYQGGSRVEYPVTWNEKNIYFELYNVHHRPNKWAVSFEEVDSFEREHPEINLKLGYKEYVTQHPGNWLKGVGRKMFLDLPYHLQHGFFFSKWAVVNKVVKNLFIIKLLSLAIILGISFFERKFIREYGLYLLTPFLYYLLLSLYTIPQLEDNWLLFCLPFLALPVVRFLTRYVNVVVLLVLQFVYLLL